MIGILCEKSSAAQNFAKALGGKRGTFNGQSHVVGTYNNEDFVIVHTAGHLYTYGNDPDKLVKPSVAARYKTWDLNFLPWNEQDFQWQKQKMKGADRLLSIIRSALSHCNEVVIATDVDPSGEGELLAWEILDDLHLKPKKWARMYFDDESVPSIQKAFVGRKQLAGMLSDMDYIKALYRSQWDFMSMQFTRIATLCGDGQSVLRQGRLKSGMVQLAGDGIRDHKAYKKIPSYLNSFRDENGIIFSSKDEPVFSKKDQVPTHYSSSSVIIDSKTIKHKAPPALLDLADLASILASKGVPAKSVLDTYQKMYEKQIVSYPRTEDKCVTPEQFNDLLPFVDQIAVVVGVDTALLTHRQPRSTHVVTGGAHGANRPGPVVPSSLDSLKSFGACAPLIYEILAKNYLSILAEDYTYESQKGHLEKYPSFIGTAAVPLKYGYRNVFSDDDDDSDDDSGPKGLGTVAAPFIREIFPPKPPLPTTKWLMKQLKKWNVGTGSTRVSIYNEITRTTAKYPLLRESRGRLSMTEYGEMSYILLKDTHIGNLVTTERLLQDMKDIANGKADPGVCLHQLQQLVRDDLNTMTKNSQVLRKEKGITMQNQQKEKYTGVFGGSTVSFSRVWRGHRFTDEECEALCNGEDLQIFGLVSKKNPDKTYAVTGRLTHQTYNGNPFVGFEQMGYVNTPGVPSVWCKHTFTDDEIAMLEAGKSIELENCESKKGNIFSCSVSYGKKEDGSMGIIPVFG